MSELQQKDERLVKIKELLKQAATLTIEVLELSKDTMSVKQFDAILADATAEAKALEDQIQNVKDAAEFKAWKASKENTPKVDA